MRMHIKKLQAWLHAAEDMLKEAAGHAAHALSSASDGAHRLLSRINRRGSIRNNGLHLAGDFLGNIIHTAKQRIKRIFFSVHSIRWKIALAYLLIICVAFYIVTASLIRLVGEYLFSQKISDEQRIAVELAEEMARPLAMHDADALYAGVRQASEQTSSRVLVLDLYGVVQADTYSEYNGEQFLRSEVADVLGGSSGSYGFYSTGSSTG